MKKQLGGIIACVACIFFVAGCKTTASDAWNAVLKPCTQNKTWTPKNMVYMGPSNNVGVGAVWRQKNEGGFGLIELAPTDARDQQGTPILNVGETATCHGTSTKSFKLGAAADLVLSQIAGASAGLSTELNRAKTADVKADGWVETQLVEGPFDRWVQSLPKDHNYRKSVERIDARVAYRAVQVTGLTAILTFEGTTAADIHAKYASSAATSSIADLGGKLTLELKEGNKLVITAPKAMFIEAELATYIPGVGIGRGGLTRIPAASMSPLTYDVHH